MSVEIQGIKGYEYQYLVTIYVALQYLERNAVSVYVETEEDAKIIYTNNKVREDLYIQVKHHNKAITFEELCTWLGHFGERQALNFLLKNIQTEGKHVLFVTTGRCEDRLLPYLNQKYFDTSNFQKSAIDVEQTSMAHKRQLTIKKQDATEMKKFLTAQPANTKLEKKRLATLQDFFDKITDSQLKIVLEKVNIAELQSYEKISALTASLLNTHYAIKSSDISHVIELLEQCVRLGRDSRCDIATDMQKILRDYTQRLLPRDLEYLVLPQQHMYEELLESQNVLLFTGLPFCGKTIAAQAIAQKFATKGFEIYPTDDINEGMAFLNNYTDSPKMLLLEDPFGSMQASENRTEQVRKLRRLVLEKSSASNKLIVTTRKDILFTAFDKKELAECTIENCMWNDLTMCDIEFAQKTWCSVYGNSKESIQCFSKIADYIHQKEQGVFLEIGEIYNLKRSFPQAQELSPQSNENILRHARISSADVVDKLRHEGSDIIRIFLALGFACNTIRKTSYRELAYILSDTNEQPALLCFSQKSQNVRMTLGGKRKQKTVKYSDYSQAYHLSNDENHILIQLEQYGYIFIDRHAKEIRFLHPVFCYAAKLLLLKELRNALDCKDYVLTGRRAIGAIDKNVNLCALEFLYACAEENNAYREEMRSVIFEALKSKYPAVRDRAILLLETGFSKLQTEQQTQLLDAVKNSEFDRYLLWEDGELMVYPEENIEPDFEDIFSNCQESSLTLEAIHTVKTKATISPKQMLDILQSKLQEKLPLKFLNIALDYDESIIREKAIHLIFQNYAGQLELNNYINELDNFNVICQMFQGALQSWPTYSEDDRQKLLSYFTAQLGRVSVSMQSKDFLENFMDEYYPKGLSWKCFTENDKTLMWETWCVVFTEFLRQFQVDFLSMHQPHMEACMRKMVNYVKNPELLKPLFYAWNGWLARVSCPDDYGMCLAENVLLYLPPDSDRFQLLFQMLQADGTSLLTSHLRHIADCWKLLTNQEREAVKHLLTTPREDLQWLKAVVLTREQIPEELQILILNGKSTNSTSEWLSALCAEGLLEPCLNIYCGYPQPLWWNGYHHAAKKMWSGLIVEELKTDSNTQDRPFQIALREFIQWEYDGDPLFEPYSEKLWEQLLTNIQKRNAVFEQLLRTTVTTNQTNKSIWNKYFNCCDDTERVQSCEKIANVIEAVEYYQDNCGCLDLFGGDIVEKYLYPLLPTDEKLKNWCFTIKEMLQISNIPLEQSFFKIEGMEELPAKLAYMFETIVLHEYCENPPRMKLTTILVRSVMQDAGWTSNELNKQLEIHRRTLLECARRQAKKFEDAYPLKKWNGE